ncbi:type 2 isopentenyl-diphosphate Delta-isomerase [Candidatus Lokiarchaeum ossiferum]|uniref:type 2 isopentenyl-diphosphate Delta-isomerase n=1 Tax=Candidatus Lokiarchaeum ossiferum TaxID=2951803 RepID=UPI00352D26EE
MKTTILDRKDKHIEIAQTQQVESNNKSWFKYIEFIHQAIPNFEFEEINTSITFLNKNLRIPLVIEALTGGTEKGKEINKILANVAEEKKIAMMVGSQRVALEHPESYMSFKIARNVAPTIPLIANIGIAQIVQYSDISPIEKIIKMIDADALAIHLNSLQEIIQPEGDRIYGSGFNKIIELRDELEIPIIIKETGAGISKEIAQKLFNNGIEIIDVAGAGGTSFSVIENHRTKSKQISYGHDNLNPFSDWGIPTTASILEVKSVSNPKNFIIGSGGIRSGIDIAKAISIGADMGGIALPFIQLIKNGPKEINEYISKLERDLKRVMLLTGSKNLKELQNIPKIIYPPLETWKNNRI